MKYFVPSKTFLAGEYSVLVGGAALGLATAPCFEFSHLQQEAPDAFHVNSPAGRYLRIKERSVGVHFYDPYLPRGVFGGFGRSTAEYFAVAFPEILESQSKENQSPEKIRQDYLSLFQDEKVKPSGVDLLIQYLGRVAYVDPQDQKYKTLSWRFQGLNFFLISTGLKIKTHEHLENLDLKRLEELPHYSNQVIDAYLNKTPEKFLQALNSWTEQLRQRQLTHLSALELQANLEKIEGVKVVKPCGALGADVMLILFDHENKERIFSDLRKQKMKVQASREDLVEGLVQYVD